MAFTHNIPAGILKAWREAHVQTVENHLEKCEKAFTDCHTCASIVVLISEGVWIVKESSNWAEELDFGT